MVKMTGTVPLMPPEFSHQGNEMASQMTSTTESSSDFSVVSQPPESNVTVNGPFSTFSDMHFGLNNATVDLSFEEMQMSIQRLLIENAELKETVQQDHMTMKSQYELMLNSKDQIEAFMKQQTERREQAKSLIEKLHAEIAELKKGKGNSDEVEIYEKQTEKMMRDMQLLKQEFQAKAEENEKQLILYHQLEMEVLELRSDCSQLKTGHSHLLAEKRELAAMNADLQARLNAVLSSEEYYDAGNGSPDGGSINQGFLVVKTGSLTDKSKERKETKIESQSIKGLLDQLATEQAKSQELMAELQSEKTKLSIVMKQVQGQEEVIRRLVTTQKDNSMQQECQLAAQLQASKQKVEEANSYIQKYQDRCNSLELHLTEYQNKLENLQQQDGNIVEKLSEEVDTLRQMLEQEKRQSAGDKKHLAEAEEKFQALMQGYRQLQHNWGNFSHEQESKGRQSEAYYCLQMKNLQESIDSLTAKLVTCEEQIMAKDEELTALKIELQNLKADAETIPILQTQVEVYKADFRAERESRERAQGEKEQALEELRNLQALANSRGLMKPVSSSYNKKQHYKNDKHEHASARRSLSASGPVASVPPKDDPVPAGMPQNRSATTAGATPAEVPAFSCPKCNLPFKEYQPLLTHVNQCLDNE